VEFVFLIKNIAMKLTKDDIEQVRESITTGKAARSKEDSG